MSLKDKWYTFTLWCDDKLDVLEHSDTLLIAWLVIIFTIIIITGWNTP